MIDNAWFPLQPGIQRITKGATGIGDERLPHQVVFTTAPLQREP